MQNTTQNMTKNMQNSDRSIFCIFDIYAAKYAKNMQNKMQNMQKICQKNANLFGICRIASGIVNRITGIGYLVRTGSESVRTGTYLVQTGTGNV